MFGALRRIDDYMLVERLIDSGHVLSIVIVPHKNKMIVWSRRPVRDLVGDRFLAEKRLRNGLWLTWVRLSM